MENGIELFKKVMTSAMNFPGVKVDRKQFLTKELQNCCTEEQLAQALICPVGVVSVETLDRLANGCISYHTKLVTGASALAGIPGGLAMLGTVPADLAQYYGHILTIVQKLAYLYGFPDLRDEQGQLPEKALDKLTVFLAVMSGVKEGNQLQKIVADGIAKHAAKQIRNQALTKTAWYPILKNVMAVLGVKMSRKITERAVSKIIPFVGALASGGVTYIAFHKESKNLQKALRELMKERLNAMKNGTEEA